MSPTALAARRPCDCDNLEQIEQHIAEQEFLHQLFRQWAVYMPTSLLTPDDVRQRANELFRLTFYGVPTEVPHGTGSGAGAAFGTILDPDRHCPLVQYLYDEKGNAVTRETQRSREERRNPPELEHSWKPITERKYVSRECAAIVKFSFVHERHHQHTCLSSSTPKSSWDNAQFFVKEDRDAYQAGLNILYAERARLKWKKPQGTCGKKTDEPSDRSWGRVQVMPAISVSMKVEIDPKHPDDIEVIRIQPDSSGKGQHYWSLRLHRQPAE